ncbi:cyclic AMP-responsive element-binding protein 3-like protein 1 [Thrips palmi]|uniref:Cyclic AMP-responsive element-binding protein 3-like protein 1 n=1 Tax=Thrips palmi TaxID=161013 RepID=A0A6P9A7K0_THRPL|nr:cyclic AMP-responsive element-binding protein 3-like protein 1 [Thrips palmi]
MSITSEMNLMDLLFDKEDPSLPITFDKDDLYPKNELIDIDTKPSFGISSEVWPSNPDEFLDSLLNGNPFDDSLLAETEIMDPLSADICLSSNASLSPTAAVVSSSSSDSGVNSDVYSDVYSDVGGEQSTHDIAEDSGASVDLQMSPLKQEVEEDLDLDVSSVPASPEVLSSPEEVTHFNVLDSAAINAGIFDSKSFGPLQLKNNTAIINMNLASSDTELPVAPRQSNVSTQQLTLRPVKTWKRNGTGASSATVRQMIRVTPMPALGSSNSSHPRSILLPLQDLKDVRTIKIVNAKNAANNRARCRPMVPAIGKGTPVTLLQVKPGTVLNTMNASPAQSCNISSSMSDILNMSGDDSSDDSSDNTMETHNSQQPYPRLVLSSEEKRLMEKEGVTLPTHYPLTKQEERELKRIRRKIRNKISAQDSRKRKKEYVDGLEDRVKQCTDENRELLKRLKVLQSQNESLATQLQRLRAVVARGVSGSGSRGAQPATCLMVLLLSLALVMVPNLRPGNNTLEDQELTSANNAISSDNKLPALPGRSRTLLHSSVGALFAADSTDDLELLDEEEFKITIPQLGKRRASDLEAEGNALFDHDFGPVETKQARYSIDPGDKIVHQFIDPAIDDVWPPPKKQKKDFLPIDDRIETMVEQLLNNKTEEPSSTLVLPVSQEGR